MISEMIEKTIKEQKGKPFDRVAFTKKLVSDNSEKLELVMKIKGTKAIAKEISFRASKNSRNPKTGEVIRVAEGAANVLPYPFSMIPDVVWEFLYYEMLDAWMEEQHGG